MLAAMDLTVGAGGRTFCRGLGLEVAPGTTWAILGRNGSGKSTLLRTLAGLDAPVGGDVLLQGRPMSAWTARERARRVAVLFQSRIDVFPGTVLDEVLTGRHPWASRWERESAEDATLAAAALTEVGLGGMEARALRTLSGGELQRTSLAAILAQTPRLFLLDEPTNHLDLRHQLAILGLIQRRVQAGDRAAVIVLHDINLAARFCDHALLMHVDGEPEHGPAAEVLTADRLSRLYGCPIRALGCGRERYFIPA